MPKEKDDTADGERHAPDTADLVRGHAEPHAQLLRQAPAGQTLFKVMSVENLLRSVRGSYLHFNRVDRYTDFKGADFDDGAPLPGDITTNDAITFEKRPDFAISHYYATARSRTYACCFALNNSDYIWENYGGGGTRGKVALVLDADKLRARINAAATGERSALISNGQVCLPIFSTNFGMIDYVDRSKHRENVGTLPNPIRYSYLKDSSFELEEEYRATLSAFGMGRFQLADGSELAFPGSLELSFDFRLAMNDGTVVAILLSPDADLPGLETDLLSIGVRAVLSSEN